MAEVAKIFWDNIFTHAVSTVVASSEAPGFAVENSYDYNTSDHWKATSAGTNYITLDYGSAVAVDSFALFSHKLASNSGSVQLYYSDTGVSGPWISIFSAVTPTDTKAILKTFTSLTKRYFKVEFVDTGSASAIGVLMLGASLSLPFNMMPGFKPPSLAWDDKVTNTQSNTGQLLGRNVIRKGVKFSIAMPPLITPAFAAGDWRSFMVHARKHPFIFAWDTTNHPTDVAYCWTVNKIGVAYASQGFLETSVSCAGLIE